MKRIVSTLLVCVLLLGCVFTLASCSKLLTGKYQNGADLGIAGGKVTYEFSMFKYTKTTTAVIAGFSKDTVEEGSFKITENDDGETVIVFTFEVDGVKETDSYSFAKGEEDGVKYVKIGGVKYTEVK